MIDGRQFVADHREALEAGIQSAAEEMGQCDDCDSDAAGFVPCKAHFELYLNVVFARILTRKGTERP